jgi:SAM-dependent methyltransferase
MDALTTFPCRSCHSHDGAPILDLGSQPLANNLPGPEHVGQPEPRFPLRLFLCRRCWLLQIGDIVPPTELFSNYLYFSSFSETMLRHAERAATALVERDRLGEKSFVVEIASNDGYLLRNFVQRRIPCLGIEPAANIAEVARKNGIDTLIEFFGLGLAETLASQGRQADLILGNNVFAHAPDTNDFVAGLGRLLKPQGVIALEFPYAADMIEHGEFDTIYHEHVFYFTLTALKPLFERHGLEIFDVERLSIHGGSLRLHACHRGARTVCPSVGLLLDSEEKAGMKTTAYYEVFSAKAAATRTGLKDLLGRLKKEGRSIAAYGASAKGSTLLNYAGIDHGTIDFVVDRSTHKQGRFTPGTHIPILPAEALTQKQPDFTLLLTWNFAEEILGQQQAYRDRGGKFIVPIPELKIV